MKDSSEPKKPPVKTRRKRLLQNLALSLAVFLLCGLALEVTLRIAGFGNVEIYQPDSKLYWRLKPNQDCYTKVDHKPVHINSKGIRGPEFAAKKAPNTIRILSLGDSRTFGWGLADEETYSRRTEHLLQESVGNASRVEVLNAGVNAWSYPQMLVYLREFGLQYQPDHVVLGEANLWTQFSEQNSPEFVKQFMRRVWLKNLLRRSSIYHFVVEVQLKGVYERHRTKFVPVDPKQDQLFKEQQQADPEAVFRQSIEGICTLAKSNGVKPVLLYLPTAGALTSTGRVSVLDVKRAVSEKLQIPLVNPVEDLRREGASLYLTADPVHFNARGNAIVAECLVETLTNSIAQ